MALIRHLFKVHPDLFPLWIERVDAPDFVLAPCQPNSAMVAVEVTDAGEAEHQEWLDRVAACPADAGESGRQDLPHIPPACPRVHHLPSPYGGEWNDDAPGRHFSTAVGEAVMRKLACKFWRNAADLPRWLVLYENTNAGLFPSAVDPEECFRGQVGAGREGGLSTLVLVRSLESVWMAECD